MFKYSSTDNGNAVFGFELINLQQLYCLVSGVYFSIGNNSLEKLADVIRESYFRLCGYLWGMGV